MTTTKQNIFSQIPKVDRVLEWPEILQLLERHPRPEVLVAVRLVLERLR